MQLSWRPIALTLYSRPGCHLCDEMKEIVACRRARSWAARSREVDISGDPELEARYGTEIPVLLVNGRKAFKYRVTERASCGSGCALRAPDEQGHEPAKLRRLCSHAMPTIAIDAMGGDFAPDEVVKGVAQVSLETDIECILVGDELRIQAILDAAAYNPEHISIQHAREFIGMAEDPKAAVRAQARRLDLGGCAAGGATGERRCAGDRRQHRRRGAGVRAALQADSRRAQGGAGERLSAADRVSRSGPARVAARRRRDDPLRGDRAGAVRAHGQRLRAARLEGGEPARRACSTWAPRRPRAARCWCTRTASSRRFRDINFVGNIEGNDLAKGKADVIVCEGLLGNVVLKLLEGLAELVGRSCRNGGARELALEARADDAGERRRPTA